MTLGDIIRAYTAEHSMSQFLKDSGLSKAYTYMLINNKNNSGAPIVPSVETIKKVAKGVHRDFNDVFAELDPDMSVSTRDDRIEAHYYYYDTQTQEVADALHKDKDLRVLFDAARNSKPEDLQMAADLLRRLKGTNLDG